MRYLKTGLALIVFTLLAFTLFSVVSSAEDGDAFSVCEEGTIDISEEETEKQEGKYEAEIFNASEEGLDADDEPTEIFLQRAPKTDEYRSFDRLDTTGLVLGVRYKSGAVGTVDLSDIEILYESADSMRASDRAVYVKHRGLTAEIPVTVRPREYDLEIAFSDGTAEFDGYHKAIGYTGVLPVGLDGIPLTAEVTGGGTDVGKYTVTLCFYTESSEYFLPPPLVATLTVLPREVRAEWRSLDLVYNGSVQAPSAYYTDVFGNEIPLEIVGGGLNAADGYVATALCRDPNYSIINDMARFSVGRAEYDMSGVKWIGGDFVFNNEPQGVRLTGLPSGVTVSEYIGASATAAGEYTAVARLTYDEINYYPPTVDAKTWSIAKGEYDLSGITVSGGEIVYDGLAHYASVTGTIPAGLDGSRVEYILVGSATDVSDGRVTSDVVFTGGSENYILPEPISVEIFISPRPVRVIWGTERFRYNGELQAPTAYCEDCDVTVEASGRNAGVYTAVASSLDMNYVIENPRLEYEIERAVNGWHREPHISSLFEGEEPIFVGEPFGGVPTVIYYEDAECTRRISDPTTAGVYYAVAVVAQSENYDSIKSEVMSFEVVKVTPLGIRAMLNENMTLRAFDTVAAEYITLYVVYNNGTEMPVDASLAEIVYEQGDSLRVSDSYISLLYLEHSCRVSVKVERAVYDMSRAAWENTEQIYDGAPKRPILVGLPDGVRVVEYIGEDAVKAGEYVFSAVVEYDGENYEPPSVPEGRLVIGKCPITPTLEYRPMYDGKPKSPTATDIFYITEDYAFVGAGEYKVGVALYDDENFYLTAPYASFVISPRRLRVELSDIELYLFERAEKFDYTITDGSVLDGEDPEIVCYESAGRIYAYANNPNYTLDIIPGRVVSLGRLSPMSSRVVLWLIFLAISVISLAVLALVMRVRGEEPIIAMRGRLGAGRRMERLMPLNPTESLAISAERADALLSDSMAKTLIRRSATVIRTSGRRSCIINVDTLGKSFAPGDIVDINRLKEKGLVPRDASRLRVLGRGVLDKPLVVYANHFSLSAVKMIALTGGEVNRVSTVRYDER